MSSALFEEEEALAWTDKEARAMLKAQGWNPEIGAQQKDLRSVTPLHLTARAGHYEQLEWLVNHGADIRALDILMNAPLHECCRGGDYACTDFIITKLFEAGGTIEELRTPNVYNLNPYELAQKGAHLACGQLILSKAGLCSENFGLKTYSEKWVANRTPLRFFDDEVDGS